MNDDDLSMSLVNKAVTYKAKAGQKKSMMGHFKAYCEDIAPWAVRLSRKAKEEHLIGRHPFMLSDYYDDIKDKAAAVLLSGVVPLETDKLSLRTSRLRDFIGRYVDHVYYLRLAGDMLYVERGNNWFALQHFARLEEEEMQKEYARELGEN